jgi:hypothetical protein
MICGQAGGGSASSGTITITGAPVNLDGQTYLIYATMNKAGGTGPYCVNVNPGTNNTFTYAKYYWTGTTFSPVTTGEVFDYMAIWL